LLDVVQRYADTMIERGRDIYGPHKSGLLLSALDRTTLAPLRVRPAPPAGIRRGRGFLGEFFRIKSVGDDGDFLTGKAGLKPVGQHFRNGYQLLRPTDQKLLQRPFIPAAPTQYLQSNWIRLK
jgi:hypothetical protein